jgi:outer membrane protein
MPNILKNILIACLCAVPSIVYAADNAAEIKAAAPPQPSVSIPIEAIKKAAATAAAVHIGYVDLARIAAESDRGKALKTLLTTRKEKLQVKVDGKKKLLEKYKASVEAKIATLTPQQREAKSKEFQKKLEEFQKFAQASEGELYSLQEKETKSLYEAIEQSATAHGKANGFAAVIVKKELLYIDSSVDAQDVTDAIIKALNQTAEKK